jgi:hypothetical protein
VTLECPPELGTSQILAAILVASPTSVVATRISHIKLTPPMTETLLSIPD